MSETQRSWFWRLWRFAVSVCATLGLLLLLVTFTPMVSWWAVRLAGPWNDAKGETLIVLAGSSGGNGIIGYGTYLRCEYAVFAWRSGGLHRVLVSGGVQANDMKRFLIAEGVPASAVQVETESGSTRESALYCRRALDGISGTKVLLTSDYHMLRAARAFRRAGADVVPCPFPDVIKRATGLTGRWPAFLDLVSESVKIAYYRVRGWI